VLTEAAIEGRSDGSRVLKENVIIGKLILRGRACRCTRHPHRGTRVRAAAVLHVRVEEEMDLATWLRKRARRARPTRMWASSPAAVPSRRDPKRVSHRKAQVALGGAIRDEEPPADEPTEAATEAPGEFAQANNADC